MEYIQQSIFDLTEFDDIKHLSKNGAEFWYARELSKLLQYTEYNKFEKVIEKAKIACEESGNIIDDHFAHVSEMVKIGSSASREFPSYMLSRYACYLIVQNADARKKVVAQGQSYFAIQTRKQEILEDNIEKLSEDEKRLALRENVKNSNKTLFTTAQDHGVSNFGKFNNAGYQGLYGGENMADIKHRKNLSKNQDILDYMGPTELAANWFRITQTDEKLKNDNIQGEGHSCAIHRKVGNQVRKTMIELGGKAPEELPTPTKSIKQLQQERKKRLKLQSKQLKGK